MIARTSVPGSSGTIAQHAFNLVHPLAHRAHPDAGKRRFRIDIKADAVVLDLDDDEFAARMQRTTAWWPCVALNVDQGFLDHTIEIGLEDFRQPADQVRMKPGAKSGAIPKLVDHGFQRRRQAAFIDRRRMEEEAHRPDVVLRPFQQIAGLGKELVQLRLRAAPFDPVQVEIDGEQVLRGRIVQFPRNPPSLLFLRSRKQPRQSGLFPWSFAENGSRRLGRFPGCGCRKASAAISLDTR